ncbi:Trypanosome variant surface glycoprotein (A-type) [Trypanosoma brucei equiperdum]|uniref:Trypanosome variant surface glycoprotein (A-type) n=2 Tax=Trypanosoma brucei TaxID=5691 RepID=A0A3L6KTN3_9TRYP|nr:variant surface glycoprotein 1125.5495 [Trypanosoma brucei]RHW67794.1 Trypanosome variant surface glycoprotein (A-type) [Trypanosoma brucei equiperdum]
MTIAAQSGNNGQSNIGFIAKDNTNTIATVEGLGACGLNREAIDGTGSGKQTLVTEAGFAALGTSKGSTGAAASTPKCALFDADNSGGMENGAQTADNLAYAAGYLTVTANSATATYTDLTGWSATNTKNAPEPYTKLYHAVNDPSAAELYAEDRPTDLTLTDIQESAQARRLYHMLTTGETTEYKETDAGAAIKSAMEQTYGDASKFKSQTWEQIGRAEVYKDPYASGRKEDTQLSTISDINTLRVSLAYYTEKSQAVAVKRIERLQQKLKADQSLQKSCDTYKTNQTCTKANCR